MKRLTEARLFAAPGSMEGETKGAESAHLLCFLIVVGFAVYAVTNGQPAGAAWLVITGIVTQIYPVLLQRYHRPRWRRARQRHVG